MTPAIAPAETLVVSDTLVDRIDVALRRTTALMRHQFQLESNAGHVVVRGEVKSYFQKQMAQEVIRRVDGVERVENRLQVAWPRKLPR